MPEDHDAGIMFFFCGERSIVVPIQAPQNFLVRLVTVAVGEALYVDTFAIFVAKVLDHLNRTMGAGIVLDKTTDESDDHDRRRHAACNGSDGSRCSCFSEGKDKRQEEEDKPDEATRTAHDRNQIIARKTESGGLNFATPVVKAVNNDAGDENYFAVGKWRRLIRRRPIRCSPSPLTAGQPS